MTELEAQRLIIEIRTERPQKVVGRHLYRLMPNRRLWHFTAVGKSGLRWALEPGDVAPDAAWLPREVKEWAAARLGTPAAANR
jgi:hypothetical protein